MKLIELKLDKDSADLNNGVFAMSIVGKPAVQMNFIKLSEQEQDKEPVQTFKLSDKEQRIISGVALIPDKKIYRDADSLGGEEGYIYFSRDTVKECSELFLKDLRNHNTTLEHNEVSTSLTLTESWIVDNPELDKAKHLGLDVPAGSWCLSYRVNDDDLWNDIKAGTYNGFSIEANMIGTLISKLSEKPNVRTREDIVLDIMNTIKDAMKN